VLGGVADDRDDDHADEERRQADRLRGLVIEPTRISDMTPTATPARASAITLLRTDQCSPTWSSSACSGLKRSLCVRSEKNRPAT
jgi:hypothetical protein